MMIKSCRGVWSRGAYAPADPKPEGHIPAPEILNIMFLPLMKKNSQRGIRGNRQQTPCIKSALI
jgi:hypothetical protein